MTETTTEFFMLGITTSLNALIISTLVTVMSILGKMNGTISEQQTLSEQMQVYNEFSPYELEHVYPQDVISVIFEYRGLPAIFVASDKGNKEWVAGDATLDYSASEIEKELNLECVYDSEIEKDANGAVSKLLFKQCADPNGIGCGLK